jgi:hypothetical protein
MTDDAGQPATERARPPRRRDQCLQGRLLHHVIGVTLAHEIAREAAQGGRMLAQFVFEVVAHPELVPFSARGAPDGVQLVASSVPIRQRLHASWHRPE